LSARLYYTLQGDFRRIPDIIQQLDQSTNGKLLMFKCDVYLPFHEIALRPNHRRVQLVKVLKEPDTGTAVDSRHIEGHHGDVLVSEIDQLVGDRRLAKVFISLRPAVLLLTWIRVVTVILLHVVSTQYAINALATQTAKIMAIGLIPGSQHRVAAMETPGIF